MNKGAVAATVLVLSGLGAAGIVGLDGLTTDVKVEPATTVAASIVQTVDPSTWRQAVADWPCLQAAGITADRLREVCLWGKRVYIPAQGIDHIVCLTDRQQVHACEVDPPDAMMRRYGTCRYQDGGQWRTYNAWVDLDWTVPDGWDCQVILPAGWWHQSMAGVEDPLVVALRSKCGWPEISNENGWGECPNCLWWPEGCGPCKVIASKYGRIWPGHEAECGS